MSTINPADLVDKYTAKSKEVLDTLLPILTGSEWKESKKEEEICFYTRSEPGSSFNQVKSVVSIPAPMENCTREILIINTIDKSTPAKEKHGFDSSTVLFEVENDPESRCFFYIALPSPGMMVSGRDFILFRRHFSVDGKEVFLCVNVEEDLHPSTGYVRGDMIFQGYMCEPDPDHEGNVRATFFVHADPKGSIPGWAYNTTATNQGYAAKGIKRAVVNKLQQAQ